MIFSPDSASESSNNIENIAISSHVYCCWFCKVDLVCKFSEAGMAFDFWLHLSLAEASK